MTLCIVDSLKHEKHTINVYKQFNLNYAHCFKIIYLKNIRWENITAKNLYSVISVLGNMKKS